MSDFWLCFVPLFVAVDALGVLPIFIGLTQGVPPPRVRRLLWQSLATALVVALAFLALGQALLALLGITVADFMVAGGIVLFVLATGDLLANDKLQRRVAPADADDLGVVPLGVPLIVGPAVLTTTILLANRHGIATTAVALVANIAIAGLIFAGAVPIRRVLGSIGERIASKIAMLLLAAIAVMMARRGIEAWLG